MDVFYAGHLWGWLRGYSRQWTLEDLHQLPVHQAAQLYYAYSQVDRIDEAVATSINRLVVGAPPTHWQNRLEKLDHLIRKKKQARSPGPSTGRSQQTTVEPTSEALARARASGMFGRLCARASAHVVAM